MKSIFLKFIVILALCCSATILHAEPPSEYKVKAAYLYNFAKFIKWPESKLNTKPNPLIIGILGENVFAGELIPLSGRTIRNNPIEVKHFKTLEDIKACQLLYINSSNIGELESILSKLKTRPIITVGDNKKFVSSGGVIQFVKVRGRLRFIINLSVAKNNKIHIDSQLLSLAAEVLETNN